MVKVVGITFKKAGKVYFFSPNDLELKLGEHVIVETARGLEFGTVAQEVTEEQEDNLVLPLKGVRRKASDADVLKYEQNKKDAVKAYNKCIEYVDKHKLDMQLIECEYTFEREQLIFYFVSEDRVDFRELVKDLAAEFKTRIELRQVGVRDEAKLIGGIGPCGLLLCCSTFLGDFASVSINMAKNQNLSLNPTKISGLCGRLLCCLTYENDVYKRLRKGMPDVGKKYETPMGIGKVVQLDILNRKFRVDVDQVGIVDIELDQVD